MDLAHRKQDLSYRLWATIGLALALLMFWAAPILAQSGPVNRPTPDPPQVTDPMRGPGTESKVATPPFSPRGLPGGGMPRSSVTEIGSSLAEFRRDIGLLREFDNELMETMTSPAPPNYGAIIADASDVKRLAIRLLRSLSLPRPDKQMATVEVSSGASIHQLNASITSLDQAIQAFCNNSALKQPRTIEAELLARAGSDLETIVARSVSVQAQAEKLAATDGRPKDGKPVITMAHLKSRLKPTTSIQLTLECSAWSIDDLLAKPSQIKDRESINISGVQASSQRHKLVQQLVVAVEDCVDAEADENARSSGQEYVAIIKDFTSYDVKGKIFAYQVTYELALTRQNQITKRFDQPLWFYYVDAAGDGNFDLFKGSMAYYSPPEWVKELTRKH